MPPVLIILAIKSPGEWLGDWLEDPTVYLPKSKMPKIEGVHASERDALSNFF